jgi:hypothetical protein
MTIVSVVVALIATEPGPMPIRGRISIIAMCAFNVSISVCGLLWSNAARAAAQNDPEMSTDQ